MRHSVTTIRHEFVSAIPEAIEDGVVYVSVEFTTVVHRCCCGCGHEVVTPLSPTDWKLIFDGETVSLDPSVGSWNLPCQSHYWIVNDRVHWARAWTRDQITAERAADRRAKASYYGQEDATAGRPLPADTIPSGPEVIAAPDAMVEAATRREGVWERLKKVLFGS
ncbi:MAG TPA: DUF6527 family protein [Urbifossiella sp.]|jgi:hypothetical protein|nr:DUF6527 family protein [Urbifossiella sp.]